MDIASILNPVYEPKPILRKEFCNKAYTLEQVHFIQYCREVLRLTWAETEAIFIQRFPDPTRDVSKVGLQCRCCRAQKYPILNLEGNPVLIAGGVIIVHILVLKERGHKGGLLVPILDDNHRPMRNQNNNVAMRELTEEELCGPSAGNLRMIYQQYFKLLDRAPEYAAGYEWVRSEDQMVAKKIRVYLRLSQGYGVSFTVAGYNKEHGIELPGAILPGRIELNTILWAEEAARRSSETCQEYRKVR